MALFFHPLQWILGLILICSSLGVILSKRPIRSCLSFLLTLFTLAVFYLELAAEFIAVMQILIYAGAILVIFMYVIVLFQDAYLKIPKTEQQSSPLLLVFSAIVFAAIFVLFGRHLIELSNIRLNLPMSFGSVQALGKILYIDFFFPFEAVILLFLVALVGALYIGKKER